MDVGNLVAKLTLDSAGFSKGISEANSLASGLAGGIGKVLGGVTTAVTASVAAAGAAVGSIVKQSVQSFAEYEQLVGGVETLFKESAGIVEDYAVEAYKNAGISANEYMSTVTSFSASLLQSLGGDTEDAAHMADMAIRDMSDNANKMGTDMSAIQTAYQGFAKQNYTMLDNLKLGYGGTKQEMERLLERAEEIKASQGELAEYSIESFADIVEAIHVVQDEMGITGTTAAEASNTIQGSFSMMKASWQDLLTSISGGGVGLSQAIQNLVESAETFIGNLMPVIQEALFGIGDLITGIAPIIAERIPVLIGTLVPMIMEAAVSIVNALIQNLPSLIQTIATAITAMIPQLVEAIIATLGVLLTSVLPALAEVAVQLVLTLGQSLVNNADLLIGATLDLVFGIIDTIIQHLPEFLEIGIKIVLKIAEGILMAIPRLFVSVGKLLGIVDDTEDHFQKKTDNIVEIVNTGTQDVSTALNGFSYNVKDYTGRVSDDVDEMGEHYEKTFDEMTKAATGFQRSAEDTSKWVKETEVKITDANGKVIDSFKTTTMEVRNVYDGISSEAIMAEKYISDAMEYVASKSEKAASSVESAVNRMNNAIGSVSGGDLIIGHRASGGPVVAGSAYMTGELGRELFVPATDGYIFNNDDTEDILGSRGGDIVIQIQGDVYDDERSMKRKVSKAVLSVIESELAYGI